MKVVIYKNPTALRWIRCVASIPGTNVRVGGAGWTLGTALARCRSEKIERTFVLNELLPSGIKPVGVAAHLSAELAQEAALQESAESLCIEQAHRNGELRCIFRLHIGEFSLGLARTEVGFFALIRGKLRDEFVVAHSASASALSALLKAWEEYRSIQFFRPSGDSLKKFSRGNFLFTRSELVNLKFRVDRRYIHSLALGSLCMGQAHREDRAIVYFFKSEGSK